MVSRPSWSLPVSSEQFQTYWMFLAVLYLRVFLFPQPLLPHVKTLSLDISSAHFPTLPFHVTCLPSLCVFLPVLCLWCLVLICLLSLWPCFSQAGMQSAHSASPELVLWVVSVATGWVGPGRKDSQGSASASWASDTSWSPQLPLPIGIFSIFLFMDTSLPSNHFKSASQTWLEFPNEYSKVCIESPENKNISS